MHPQTLTYNEAKALLEACPNTTNGIRDKAVLAVLYRSGTRIGETLKIRPCDIDWEQKKITIHHGKGGKSRVVSIDHGALDILKVWAERRKSLGLNGRHPFFCATNKQARGNELHTHHYRAKIKELQAAAGIEKECNLHMLRHTAASQMLEEGFDILTISRQLGHASLHTTDIYVHRLRPDLVDARLKVRAW